jgi:hypothetical protein
MNRSWIHILGLAVICGYLIPGSAGGGPGAGEDACRPQNYINDFRLKKLGLGSYVIDVNKNCSASALFSYKRTNDPQNPGDYFEYPTAYSNPAVDSADTIFIKGLLLKYLKPEYFSENMLDSIENVYLVDLGRKEFFYQVQSAGTRFRFSGWYGKFAHIFVFTDFDSKAGFIEKAQEFCNLPPLDINKVSFDENTDKFNVHDFFYSYDDPESDFKLYGYPDLHCSSDEKTGLKCSCDYVILDLTVYAEEE